MKRVAILILILASIAIAQESKKIVVGSKSFTESRILGEIIAQLVEARTDIEVGRKHGLAGSVVTFNAIKNGDIDIYPEYTGTAWSAILKRKDTSSDPLRTYVEVKRILEKEHGLTVTAPFGFNNTYIVAVRPETAQELGLKTVSDIKGNETKLRFGWSTEFLNRPDGWPGLVKTYGLKNVSVRGMEHGLAYQAIGSGNVDVIDAYSTDGKLRELKLTFLTDDKKFFPPYHAAPAVRLSTLEKYPETAVSLLNELSYRIDEEAMQSLNHEVEEEEKAFESVAKAFLVREKLIDSDAETTLGENIGSGTLSEFITARIPVTIRLIGEHLLLTVIAVVLGILIAVPLGIWLTRNEKFTGPILGIAGVIQTIPSLALLAFMIPIPLLGLSMQSAIVALFLYSLLPIIRNTYTGIKEVDENLVESGTGLGLTDMQLLRNVQLPLAFPTIMAGIRTAAVISIGVATLAAFIGAGGLGQPIITGLQLNEPRLILAGAIPAAILALATDWILGLVERRMST